MAKVDLDLVKMVLTRAKIDAVQVAKIIEDISLEQKIASQNEEKEPAAKKQFVFVLSDPQGKFSKKDEFTGWVVQIPEDESVYETMDKLHLGAYDFNRSAKGRSYPVKTIAEACEFVGAKFFKEHKIWVKTKEPVSVILTNNKIPTE